MLPERSSQDIRAFGQAGSVGRWAMGDRAREGLHLQLPSVFQRPVDRGHVDLFLGHGDHALARQQLVHDGRTRWYLQVSSSVGIRPVFLSGFGAISVVRTAYRVPARSWRSSRNRRMPRMGLPNRPGELNRYRSAGGNAFGSTSWM